MRRKRVTGRFYIFLLIVALIIFLIVWPNLSFGPKEAVVMAATAAYTQHTDAVIVRDEDVFSSESTARVEYVAMEGTLVEAGDTVAYLYSAGYTEKELEKLEDIRQNIQAYHKSILANIVDTQLTRYDAIVDARALEFKSLVTHQTSGNLNRLTRQLEAAMVERQEYMRQNKREDLKLNKLYEDENSRLNSISSWRTVAKANEGGVVSFYLDGYEDYLTVDKLATLTPEQLRTVLAGGSLGGGRSRTQGIYRVVNQNRWYAVILAEGDNWNPVVGQQYYLQMEGFEDVSYDASVTRVQKMDGQVIAEFEINDPIGPLLYERSGKVALSTELSGLSVPSEALYEQNGQIGVWVYDVPGGTFVAVEVLSNDGKNALVQPLLDGALQLGQRILIK